MGSILKNLATIFTMIGIKKIVFGAFLVDIVHMQQQNTKFFFGNSNGFPSIGDFFIQPASTNDPCLDDNPSTICITNVSNGVSTNTNTNPCTDNNPATVCVNDIINSVATNLVNNIGNTNAGGNTRPFGGFFNSF